MSTGIVHFKAAPVLYVRARAPHAAAAKEAWTGVLEWVDKQGVRADVRRMFGLVRDHDGLTSASICRYDACIEVPEGYIDSAGGKVSMQLLPTGAFARHRHTEGLDLLGKSFTWLAQEWAPGRRMAVDTARPVVEAYMTDPLKPANGRLRMDLCVPMVAAERRRVA